VTRLFFSIFASFGFGFGEISLSLFLNFDNFLYDFLEILLLDFFERLLAAFDFVLLQTDDLSKFEIKDRVIGPDILSEELGFFVKD